MKNDDMIGVAEACRILNNCSRQSVHNWATEHRLDGEYVRASPGATGVRRGRLLRVSRASCERLAAEMERRKAARTPESSKDTPASAELKHSARFALEQLEFEANRQESAATEALQAQNKLLEEISRKLGPLARVESLLDRILSRMPEPGGGFPWETVAVLAPVAAAAVANAVSNAKETGSSASDEPKRVAVPFRATDLESLSTDLESLSTEDRAAYNRATASAARGEEPSSEDFQVWCRVVGWK